jgi:hypothetical protein
MAYCRGFGVTLEGEEITQPCPSKGRASCCNGSQLISDVRQYSLKPSHRRPLCERFRQYLASDPSRCTPSACGLIFTIIVRHCMMRLAKDAPMGTTRTLIVAAPHQVEASCPCNSKDVSRIQVGPEHGQSLVLRPVLMTCGDDKDQCRSRFSGHLQNAS